MRALIAGLLLLTSAAGAAEAPRLAFPVQCRAGETCWISQTMNHGAVGEIRDYACGRRSSVGNESTDIAVRDMVAVARGVTVQAAAAGTVASVRDGMADGGALIDKESVKDRDCGNGVVLDHGDGWHTQYCHLRQDSIVVKPGERVTARQPLGLLGLSGQTEHPHLSVTLRHQDRAIDPFVGMLGLKDCRLGDGHLWAREDQHQLGYSPVDIIVVGISDVKPTPATVVFGAAARETLTPDAPAMILWTMLFGAQRGDAVTLRIYGPNGAPFLQDIGRVTADQPVYVRFAGHPRKSGPRKGGLWPTGTYTGEVILQRTDAKGLTRQWRQTGRVIIR